MPSPAWFSGLIDWWSMRDIRYDDVPGGLIDTVGAHDGTFAVPSFYVGIDAFNVMEMLPGDAPLWHCSLGGALHAIIFPTILTNFDLKGVVPYNVIVNYSGGTPWYTPTSWSFAIWANCDTVGFLDPGPPPLDSYPVSDGAISHYEQMTLVGDEISDGASRHGWRIRIGTDGKTVVFSDSGGLSVELGVVPDTDYHLYSVSSDGVNVYGYMDGVLGGSIPAAGFQTSASGLRWGMRNVTGPGDIQYAEPWYGQFADTLMWDRALSADDWADFFLGLDCAQSYRIRNRFYAERGTTDLGDLSHPGA